MRVKQGTARAKPVRHNLGNIVVVAVFSTPKKGANT